MLRLSQSKFRQTLIAADEIGCVAAIIGSILQCLKNEMIFHQKNTGNFKLQSLKEHQI